MARDVRSHLRYQLAQHVLRRALGTYRGSLLVILALLLSVSIAAGGIQSLLQQLSAGSGVPSWIIELLPLTALLAVLYLLARRGPSQPRPVIHEHTRPAQTRVLILFLSPAPKEPHAVYDIRDGKKTVSLTDREFLNSLTGSWRMPLEAITYHAAAEADGVPGVLERVVVIPSSDRVPGDGTGTVGQVKLFRDLISKLREADPRASEFTVVDLHQQIHQQRVTVVKDYKTGVAFERPQELEEALYHAYCALNEQGFADEDVLVDVTGGKKPPSIAGAVVALAPGRRIQYVSTDDYRVRVYDITLDFA